MRAFLAATLLAGAVLVNPAHAEERIGASYFSATLSGNTTTTIFLGSANANGASIRTASLAAAGSNNYLQADYPDGTHHVIYTVQGINGSPQTAMMAYPILLPPGVGLSVSNSGNYPAGAFLTYDLH